MKATRELTERKTVYTPPDNTNIPEEVKNHFLERGLVLRWIRHSLGGKEDTKNIAYRLREGWEPVRGEDMPKGYQDFFQIGQIGGTDGAILNNDVFLASLPESVAIGRQNYYEQMARDQEAAVNRTLMNQSTRAMPIQNESRTESTRGRKPAAFGKTSDNGGEED